MSEVPRVATRPLISRRRAFAELANEHKTAIEVICVCLLALTGGILFVAGAMYFLLHKFDAEDEDNFLRSKWWLAAFTFCEFTNVTGTMLLCHLDPANGDTYSNVSVFVGGYVVVAIGIVVLMIATAAWMILTLLAGALLSPVILWVAVTRRSGRSPYKITQAVAHLPGRMLNMISSGQANDRRRD